LAKTLAQDPSIIIFDEPTRGVDVGTIPHIHAEIRRLADEGKAIVVISSYLPEILAVSDRILVARTGRIVAEFDAADATQDKILYARCIDRRLQGDGAIPPSLGGPNNRDMKGRSIRLCR